MTTLDNSTQKMIVTVTFELDEEIFEGETDMYEVADDLKDHIEEGVTHGIMHYCGGTNFKMSVKPKLT